MSKNEKETRRVVFVNRFFYPDESATSLMLSDLVFGIRLQETDLRVIATRSHYAGEKAQRRRAERFHDVTVHRLPSAAVRHHSVVGKVLNFLLFYALSFCAVLKIARPNDTVVCLTDPPLGNVVITLAAKLKRARMINWVQDIYPETATRLGVGADTNPLIRLFRWMRDKAWRAADANVVIGSRMQRFLEDRTTSGAPALIQNWSDEERMEPVSRGQNEIRSAWGYANEDCVVGYSGNLGRAHDYMTTSSVIRAVEGHEGSRLRFLFVGGGTGLEKLKASTKGCKAVAFQPYQPRSKLRESLSAPDIHWLSLAPQLEGLIVPSKFYGAAAAGRPVVFIGDPAGEVARLIAEGECGRAFAPGEHEAIARYLLQLQDDESLRLELGRNARRFSVEVLARQQRFDEWERLLTEFVRSASDDEPSSRRNSAEPDTLPVKQRLEVETSI